MNFFLHGTEYISTLRQKGFSDEGFYNEYDFICLEIYKNKNPNEAKFINQMQHEKLLERSILR